MAVQVLSGLRTPRATDMLLSLITCCHDDVVDASVRALAGKADSLSDEPLLSVLTSPNHPAKRAVVRALGRIADKRAVGPLIQIISKPTNKYHEVIDAATALKSIGDLRGAEPLRKCLASYMETLSPLASSISFQQVSRFEAITALVTALASFNDRRDVPLLLQVFRADSLLLALDLLTVRESQAIAAQFLIRFGDVQTVTSLIPCLSKPPTIFLRDQIYLRLTAEVLAGLGHPGAIRPLVQRAKSDKSLAIEMIDAVTVILRVSRGFASFVDLVMLSKLHVVHPPELDLGSEVRQLASRELARRTS